MDAGCAADLLFRRRGYRSGICFGRQRFCAKTRGIRPFSGSDAPPGRVLADGQPGAARGLESLAMPIPLRVLIVENCDDDAVLMVDCLAKSGYDLCWERAQSAEELAAALAPPHEWDLILSDYAMPGFGGMAALEICQSTGRDIPFILISGSVGEERAVEAMRCGAHDYIMKDRMQRLGPAVERELREAALRKERRTAVDENVRLGSELVVANAALTEKLDQLSRSRAHLEPVAWAAGHDLKEP